MTPSSPFILSAIVAMDENRLIGKNNQLLWRMPADLRHFKKITTGHAILMGRKTFESIGKALPNRTNIIITRDKQFKADGCIVVHSLHEAIEQAAKEKQDEIFVIGGAEIFREFLPEIERIYLTIIHHRFEGDAVFPELNPAEWREVDRRDFPSDNENLYAYSFIRLERNY